MRFVVAGYTDSGRRKTSNQDSFCVRRAQIVEGRESVFAVVCDGMGGVKKGELASAELTLAMGNWYDNNFAKLPKLCIDGFGQVRTQWKQMMNSLHQQFRQYAIANEMQMGSTIAAFLTFESHFLVMHIGDSRVYECKDALRRLTRDHSLVEREVAARRITEEAAHHHPQRNVLLQCVGIGDEMEPEFTEGLLRSDAFYLLCTDGLVHELFPDELEKRLSYARLKSKQDMTAELTALAELCKLKGEEDNISGVLIRTSESDYVSSASGIKGLISKFSRKEKTAETPILLETAQIVHTKEHL